MALTKSQILAEVNSLLASGTNIEASEHRQTMESIIDKAYDENIDGVTLAAVPSGGSELIFTRNGGAGTSIEIPLDFINAVVTDATLTGDGTTGTPLSAVQQDISGIATNAADIATIQGEQITQDAAIALNTAKVGITPTQAADITANNAKISYTDSSVVSQNTIDIGNNTTAIGLKADKATLTQSGGNVTGSIDTSANTFTLTASGTGGGEINTASNIGTGEGVFAQKSASDLEFKSLKKVGAALSIASDANSITYTLDDSAFATAAQGTLADTAIQSDDLATVATTGSYTDLTNQPTIPPAAPVDSVNGNVGVVVLDGTDVELIDGGGVSVTQAISDLDTDKLENSSQTNRLLGRYSSGTGQVEQIQIGSGLSLTAGGTLQASGGGGADLTKEINQVAHSFVLGSVVRLDGSTYVAARADTESMANAISIVIAVTDVDNFTIQSESYVDPSIDFGLTDGQEVWLGQTGGLTTTEPTNGEINVFLGQQTPQGLLIMIQQGFLVETDGGNGGWSFAEIDSTPYAVADWDTVFGVHNETENIEITLPNITAGDIGKELKFWIEHNPANYKVVFKANNTSLKINGVSADGAEVAKGEVRSSYPSYLRLSVRAVESNQYYIEAMDSVYNQLRYVVSFDASSSSSPYSYLQFSAIPTGWNWRTQSWFAYMKIEKPMLNDSNGQVLFGSNNFFIAYRGNGTYFMTSGTSGYLQGLSPNTIAEAGEYILYQYDSSADSFSAWVNGVKVMNATTSGVTPSSTAPTEMWVGSEEAQENQFTDLVLSGMTNTNYNQTYEPLSNVKGRWWSFDNEIDEAAYPDYLIYSYDAGGGTWYTVLNDKSSGQWFAGETTTDPSIWTDGTVVTFANVENIINFSSQLGDFFAPWESDSKVMYDVPSSPSGYGYPLQQCKISVMGLGTGNLSDADAALFTSTEYDPQANITLAGGGTFVNQWSGGTSQMSTDLGSVDLTAVGSNITFEEI